MNTNERSHTRLVGILAFIIAGMFVFGFALVPIYNSLCKTLGINGKTNSVAIAYDAKRGHIDNTRMVSVEFVATNNGSVAWKFYPSTKRIKLHPGEVAKLSFYAENLTNNPMTVQAIPSVTPGIAAKYIKKTECFCFAQQTLGGHEAMDMPLLFHLDPDLPENVKTLTLSYTLFDVSAH